MERFFPNPMKFYLTSNSIETDVRFSMDHVVSMIVQTNNSFSIIDSRYQDHEGNKPNHEFHEVARQIVVDSLKQFGKFLRQTKAEFARRKFLNNHKKKQKQIVH